MKAKFFASALLSTLLSGVAIAATAQDRVPDLEDLIGVRGRDGEYQLQQRGYEHRWTEKTTDSAYSYWTQISSGQCITVRTTDGRYASIVAAPTLDCDRGDPRHIEGPHNTTPRVLADLIGVRGSSAEMEMRRRGYTYRDGQEVPDGVATFWIEGRSGDCVEVITRNGRYQEIFYVEWYHCDVAATPAPRAGRLSTFDQTNQGIPVTAQYPADEMRVNSTGSGEGVGVFFDFKPQGTHLDVAEVHVFLPAGEAEGSLLLPFITGPNGLIASNGWIVDSIEADGSEQFSYPWLEMVINFSTDREESGHILLGQAHGQAVQVTLFYPAEMSDAYWPAARDVLESLVFDPNLLPIPASQL